MPNEFEAVAIRFRMRNVLDRERAMFERYAEAKDRCDRARNELQLAWGVKIAAMDRMNQEYWKIRKKSADYCAVWDEYERVCEECYCKIDYLRDVLRDRCSGRHDSKKRRAKIEKDISNISRDINSARRIAKKRAPKIGSSAFRDAKDEYMKARGHYFNIWVKHHQLKTECDSLEASFLDLKKEREKLESEFKEAIVAG